MLKYILLLLSIQICAQTKEIGYYGITEYYEPSLNKYITIENSIIKPSIWYVYYNQVSKIITINDTIHNISKDYYITKSDTLTQYKKYTSTVKTVVYNGQLTIEIFDGNDYHNIIITYPKNKLRFRRKITK